MGILPFLNNKPWDGNFAILQLSLSQLIIWFFIFAFLGWVMECIVIRIQEGRWENRGFAKLPFCIIYGFGVLIASFIMAPIQHNMVLLYFACAIGATIFEFLTGLLMQRLFGDFWWDYNNKKFNYKGMICLESTIGWGFIGIFVIGFFNVRLIERMSHLDEDYATPIAFVLFAAYTVDFVLQFRRNYIKKQEEDSVVSNVVSTNENAE